MLVSTHKMKASTLLLVVNIDSNSHIIKQSATKHKSHRLIELSKTQPDFWAQIYSRPASIMQFMILVIY